MSFATSTLIPLELIFSVGKKDIIADKREPSALQINPSDLLRLSAYYA